MDRHGREGRGEVNPWKMLYGQVSKQNTSDAGRIAFDF
jgi:hypothetical protein